MAVEVAKQVEKHAVIASLIIAGFTFIAVALAGTVVSKAMLARVINVEPGANGLGHISSELSDNKLGDSATQAGQGAGRSILLQSAAQKSE